MNAHRNRRKTAWTRLRNFYITIGEEDFSPKSLQLMIQRPTVVAWSKDPMSLSKRIGSNNSISSSYSKKRLFSLFLGILNSHLLEASLKWCQNQEWLVVLLIQKNQTLLLLYEGNGAFSKMTDFAAEQYPAAGLQSNGLPRLEEIWLGSVTNAVL